MLYTIGHRANYQAAREKYGQILKMTGGYAFQTVDAAVEEIIKRDHLEDWGVFGLDADWKQDTEVVDGVQWRVLTRDVPLVFLESGST